MAGPIRIAVLADNSQASQSMRQFADNVDSNVRRASTSVQQSGREMAGGFDAARESADDVDQKAMGFRDTITGLQDTAGGFSQLAKGDLAGGLLTLGMGVGDLASGMSNFLIPAFGKGVAALKATTIGQWALNSAFLANPLTWIIIAIIALVAALVLAYKKSATFRAIVQAVWGTIKAAWGAIPGFVGGIVGKIGAFFSGMKDKITGFFSGAGGWLKDAASKIIRGFVDGLNAGFQWVKDTLGRLTSLLPDWKGPESTDRKILRGAGRMVIGGFQQGLEDRYAGVRSSLGRFTNGLGGAVSADLTAAGSAGGTSTPTFVLDLGNRPSGADALLLRYLRELFRANGIRVLG